MPEQPVPSDTERMRRDTHVNEQGTATDVGARQESPEAAVVGLVAVVSHDPIVLGWYDDRPPVVRGGVVVIGISANVLRQLEGSDLATVLLIVGRGQRDVQRIRLVQALAIADHGVVDHLQRVARHADQAFHDVEIGRGVLHRSEHDHLVPVRRPKRREPAAMNAYERNLELATEYRLVDEQEVPDEEGVLHARRGNAKRFHQERPQHDPDQ